MRREFSKAVRLAAWQRAKGNCEKCTRKLFTGDIHYDHINPDGLTGDPTLENCAVLCRSCHSKKTATEDIPNIAKAKRREARHIGIRKPSSLRNAKYRKLMSGKVQDRITGEILG